MVRKYLAFAFGLALIVALGLAMVPVHPQKALNDSDGFSIPCEPASLSFKSTSEWKVASSLDPLFAVEKCTTPAAAIRRHPVEAIPVSVATSAPEDYPPLLHRPPPANS